MKLIKSGIGVLLIGAGFGAITSLINDVSSPYRTIGSRLVNGGWAWVAKAAEVASLLTDIGWAWAGLAVGVGWSAGTRRRGAMAGALALIAATMAYYCVDGLLAGAFSGQEMLFWWLASAVFGPALGAVGTSIERPGTIGLLARLTVPIGAIVQMSFQPPDGNLPVVPTAAIWTRVIVLAAATVAIVIIIIRFLAADRRRRSSNRHDDLAAAADSR